MTRLIRATVILALVLGAVVASAGRVRPASDATTEDLTLIARGGAAGEGWGPIGRALGYPASVCKDRHYALLRRRNGTVTA